MNKTKKYYKQNHKALIKRYDSVTLTLINQLFYKYIKPNSKVLDIGFGSGRDLRYIRTLKADCYGIDSCQGFVDALSEDDSFQERIFYGQLPDLSLDVHFRFDVIILVAVLMHLSRSEIVKSIEQMKSYLVDGGLVIVSYSVTPRVDDERFFEDLRGGVIEEAFLGIGFRLVEESWSFDLLNREIEWKSEVYYV